MSSIEWVFVPDPLERMEMDAEAHMMDATKGLPPGHCRCAECEAVTPWDDMHPSGPSPYAPPICGLCMDAEIARLEAEAQADDED